MRETVAILLNAPALDCSIDESIIICADGGYNLLPTGKKAFAIVGDLDSIQTSPKSDNIILCPTEKDYSDGEKAVYFAYEQGFTDIVIYGAAGGRFDHMYANLSLLALAHRLGMRAKIKGKNEQIYFFQQGKVALNLKPNTTLSVLPFEEKVTLSDSKGLHYPYRNLTLSRYHSVGLSNKTTAENISFEIQNGSAFIFINT